MAAPQQEDVPDLLDHSEPWTEQEWLGHLHELVDGVYREVAHGPVVQIAEPFAATLDLPHLAR